MKSKTIIITAIACIMAMTTFGRTAKEIVDKLNDSKTTSEYRNGITTQEWKDVFDYYILTTTNDVPVDSPFVNFGIIMLYNKKDFNTLSEYDGKLARANFASRYFEKYIAIPNMVEVYFNATNIPYNKHPLLTQIVRQKKTGSQLWKQISFEEYVNAYAEFFAVNWGFEKFNTINFWKDNTMKLAIFPLKRAMRQQGKSFVSGDGKNPLQDELDALSAALNAPKFNGLKEWFAKWFPTYQWHDITFMTDAQVKELQDKVFYGEIPFSIRIKSILLVHLGVDAFNEFVTQYNGSNSK